MKRMVFMVMLFLLLGAIVNVAVAWACTLLPMIGNFGRSDRLIAEYDENGQVVYESLAANESGWPVRALSCGRHEEGLPLRLDVFHQLGLKSKDPQPIRLLWPGFAINTLFYGVILWGGWLLFAAPFALRRRRRIKRGQCPKCAYPVGTSDKCTECGATIPWEEGRARRTGRDGLSDHAPPHTQQALAN